MAPEEDGSYGGGEVKVVSIAAFGKGDKYLKYLPAFVIAHANLFPAEEDWQLRLQLGTDVAKVHRTLARAYHEVGLLTLTEREPEPLTKAMLWRMAPVFDGASDFVFCRDLDAAPLPRDRAVCEQFISSGCFVHTVHDNVHHIGIMGGLCGFLARAFREVSGWRSLEDMYNSAGETQEGWAKHGTDQNVLNRHILNNPAMKLLEHRFSGWSGGPYGTARNAGVYNCKAWSMPIPNTGISALTPEIAAIADRLATHMGAPGYDHDNAIRFWATHGKKDIVDRMLRVEKDIV